MDSDLKRKYIEVLRVRYQQSSRAEKGAILKELCLTTGYHRKYAIRVLNASRLIAKKPGRKRVYSDEVIGHLKRLWLEMDQICSKKIVAALPLWLPFYNAPESIKEQLLSLSHSTIDRALKTYRTAFRRARRAGTKPGRLLKSIIPIKPFDYNATSPGFVEADTVAHCGGSLRGSFIWSLDFTDVHSGWTECRAIWNKGGPEVLKAIEDIEASLPFVVRAFNSDNGSEFLNHRLIEYFKAPNPKVNRYKPADFTRSRANRKNDNCHVEQKNWTHVRQIFGYDRFDDPVLLGLMNDIYKNEHRLLQNCFIPQVKLKSKLRIGAKYKRTYTEPLTPYERLLASESITKETKQKLTELFKTLNPFHLRKEQERKLKLFYKALRQVSDHKGAA